MSDYKVEQVALHRCVEKNGLFVNTFASLRHNWNSLSRFSFFTSLFSWLTIRTCSKITGVQFAMYWWW